MSSRWRRARAGRLKAMSTHGNLLKCLTCRAHSSATIARIAQPLCRWRRQPLNSVAPWIAHLKRQVVDSSRASDFTRLACRLTARRVAGAASCDIREMTILVVTCLRSLRNFVQVRREPDNIALHRWRCDDALVACCYCVAGSVEAAAFAAATLRNMPDTISGSLASRSSSTRAAPVGERRLHSQLRNVPAGMPSMRAKLSCVPPTRARIAATSIPISRFWRAGSTCGPSISEVCICLFPFKAARANTPDATPTIQCESASKGICAG